MNRKLLTIGTAMLVAVAALSSCLGDDDTTTYDEAGITGFTLGTLKRTLHTTTASGADSTYMGSVTGSNYSFYIDQVNGLIYNPDSLPVNTNTKKCVVTISTTNSSVVAIKSLTSDSLFSYSSTDSIDFSQPRTLRVIGTSRKAYRDYTVSVNVHKEYADTFSWARLADQSVLADMEKMRAAALGGTKYVFGLVGGTTRVVSTTNGTSWTTLSTNVALTTTDIVAHKNRLFTVSGGQIYSSADGAIWNAVGSAAQIERLVASGSAELYGMGSGSLYRSTDEGASWELESLEDDATMLPTDETAFATIAVTTNDSTEQVVLAGSRSASAYPSDTTGTTWHKLVEYSSGSVNHGWERLSSDIDYKINLTPRVEHLTMVEYDGGILAFGGAGIGSAQTKAFSQFWRSIDSGLTWKKATNYQFPAGFASSATSFAALSDDSGNLWIFCGGSGQVWRGHINSLGWQKNQTVFTE